MLKEAAKSHSNVLEASTQAVGMVASRFVDPVGQLYYRFVGIRQEFPELNPVALTLLTLGSVMHARKHHTINEKIKELGEKLNAAEYTIAIADTIVAASSEKVQRDWQTRRTVEFERLAAMTEKGAIKTK